MLTLRPLAWTPGRGGLLHPGMLHARCCTPSKAPPVRMRRKGCEGARHRSPALAGLCGSPGDTVFLCSAGCCGERSRGSVSEDVTRDCVTSELPGLLNCSVFWLVTGTVTGMAKLGAGTAD